MGNKVEDKVVDKCIGNEKVLRELKDIFSNVNNSVQFAEAKNGALIGINGIFLFKCIDFLISDYNNLSNGVILLISIIILIFMTGMIIALFSFLPNTKSFKDDEEASEDESEDESEGRISIFFIEIAMYKNSQNYLRDLYKKVADESVGENNMSKIELDYAKEIRFNSKIANSKFKKFKIALCLNMLGIAVVGLFVIIA